MKGMCTAIAVVAAAGVATNATASITNVGFDGGDDGGFTGNAFFEATGGNPGGNAWHLNDSFFLELRTGGPADPSNPAFLGDYGQFTSVTLGLDVKVDSLTDFIGNPSVQELGVMLIDHDTMGTSGPAGVFFSMGLISSFFTPDWTGMEVTISDPNSATLPAGWIGFGSEDPMTFEPVLPDGSTFASVLADVDEFRITSAVPGFFYTNSLWDVRIDNVRIETVPTPGSATLGLVGGAMVLRRRRR